MERGKTCEVNIITLGTSKMKRQSRRSGKIGAKFSEKRIHDDFFLWKKLLPDLDLMFIEIQTSGEEYIHFYSSKKLVNLHIITPRFYRVLIWCISNTRQCLLHTMLDEALSFSLLVMVR
ncbi:uncharacterized protein LOC131079874 [Cryptomeria japonica]|uniref:uncharacterized protein LOC131079874 n=1 Tax=Cryptomeria japonica TaxID=3369 RepID=UPI0025AC6744|nr:uncharacterized protein LOC131079874 [Cryptomeria japonica]